MLFSDYDLEDLRSCGPEVKGLKFRLLDKVQPMDWQKILANVAKCYDTPLCECGGNMRVTGQALGMDPKTKKFGDYMRYCCDKCGKETEKFVEADHLNEVTSPEERDDLSAKMHM